MATRSGGSRSGEVERLEVEQRKRGAGSGHERASRGAPPRRQRRGDKSVEAFRDALERSVTLSRDRLQEVVDDAVRRGRMTRDDANELVSSLITRGRPTATTWSKSSSACSTRRGARSIANAPDATPRHPAAGRAARAARDAADAPLAQADRLRRRAGVTAGGPITAYDQLTAAQIKSRLGDLARPSCASCARARRAARRARACSRRSTASSKSTVMRTSERHS